MDGQNGNENENEKKLLSITNDYVFKRIFAHKNRPALAEFLACVLDMTVEELGELTVDDPHMERDRKDGKGNVLDIKAHTSDGEIINLEVQVNPEIGFRERLAFLNSRTFTEQLDKGKGYWELNRTITIVVVDIKGLLITENADCVNRFQWYNVRTGTLLTNTQEIDVLELFKLPPDDDGSRLWKWMRFFKSREEDEMEELAKDNKEMQKVMTSLREMSEDEYERALAFQRDKDEWDRIAQIEYGRRQGIEIGKGQGIEIGKGQGIEIGKGQGIEIGEARGEARANKKNASSMKTAGIPADTIARITGLSAEEIAAL